MVFMVLSAKKNGHFLRNMMKHVSLRVRRTHWKVVRFASQWFHHFFSEPVNQQRGVRLNTQKIDKLQQKNKLLTEPTIQCGSKSHGWNQNREIIYGPRTEMRLGNSEWWDHSGVSHLHSKNGESSMNFAIQKVGDSHECLPSGQHSCFAHHQFEEKSTMASIRSIAMLILAPSNFSSTFCPVKLANDLMC